MTLPSTMVGYEMCLNAKNPKGPAIVWNTDTWTNSAGKVFLHCTVFVSSAGLTDKLGFPDPSPSFCIFSLASIFGVFLVTGTGRASLTEAARWLRPSTEPKVRV